MMDKNIFSCLIKGQANKMGQAQSGECETVD